MIKFIKLIPIEARPLLIKAVGYGIITGVFNLLIIINVTHVDKVIKSHGYINFFIIFLGLLTSYLVANFLSLDTSAKLTNKIILEIRLRIQEHILWGDYKDFEEMGNDALYTINQDDVERLERYAEVFPRIIINIFVITIVLAYMMYLNTIETCTFIGISAFTFYIFFLVQSRFRLQYKKTRQVMDKVTTNIHSLVEGMRELKINAEKSKAFFHDESIPTLNEYHKQKAVTSRYDQLTISWGWASLYIILAICICILDGEGIESKIKYLVPLLMIFTPLTTILSSISTFYTFKVSLEKIHGLEVKPVPQVITKLIPFESLTIKNLKYAYAAEDGNNSFKIGPINFEILPRKIIFIIGGNGSGKSTLIKLLTGLYLPGNDQIIVNSNYAILRENISHYQAYLSVIYQTPYIFSRILLVDIIKKKNELEKYLKLFELENKVIIENNTFKNLDKLSYGQKKRLGLIIALLEDRPIYIFDEWAADQDPHFRKIFYLTILPNLKNMGKAIIAVTHDDEFFEQADEVIKLRDGEQVK